MENSQSTGKKYGGVDRSHDPSIPQKVVFILDHLLGVAVCGWLLWGGGVEIVGKLFGQEWKVYDYTRGVILFGAAALYWVRHAITLFYLLQRKIEWSEVITLAMMIGTLEIVFFLVGLGVFRGHAIPLRALDYFAIFLVLFGSFLNTYSELQRKWWKQKPENKGHCYTGGLFKYSAHINYFGDTVLFTGWALLTGSLWALIVPLLMALSFIFYHIPALDQYLADRYGEEFTEYQKKTKKFIPFIY